MGTSLKELDRRAYPLAQAFRQLLERHGVRTRINSVRRDPAEQAVLWKNYQRCGCSSCPPRPGHCFPAAPPGQSTHGQGIAFDMSVEPRSALPAVGALWERLGFTWGGRFGDPIHFDFRPR
jgi:hypothetical protein